MKLQIIFITLACMIQIKCHTIGSYNEIGTILQNLFQEYSSADCTKYANDDEVYKSFPFELDFNSSKRKSSKTYAEKNANGNIIVLNINKQEYVPPSVFCLAELQELHIQRTKFRTFDLGLPIAIERLASTLINLTISDTPISYLPEQIGRLKRLQELKLLNTSLTTLPNSIGKLSSLVHLNLRGNKLISLPSTIINTHSLQTLILNNNADLRSIEALNGHSNLKVLQADNCQIERIPLNLSKLTDLKMSNNSLTDLSNIHTLGDKTNILVCFLQSQCIIARILTEVQPDARFISWIQSPLDCTQYNNGYEILSSFSFVTHLNPISSSSSQTYGLMDSNENVYYLNIANQKFVPLTVFCLKSLRELHIRNTSFYEFQLDDNSIHALPSEIEFLAPSLTRFAVYDTPVAHLPEQIGKLRNLQWLTLSNIGLIDLPNSIGNLSSLKELRLHLNKLTSLPTTLANLRNLVFLSLDNNRQLRSVQSLNDLPTLQSLYTTNCSIERLPSNLPNLQLLYMSGNNLADLVNIRTLGNNSNLPKYFYFSKNRIHSVPPQIGYIRDLYRLDLDHNELTSLPSDLLNVTTLHDLYIRNNRFNITDLQIIAAKFKTTNPNLNLKY
ncbi:unnamed protein product [Adineta steineri]|uniref:Disease resistance R13L4/SHOC-2-like LRR domain-containing protein n=1 Tax=Adineta steineri TaxID=433720 RepID=A0A814WSW8_9BILA|nr:unnamed protein product [Adineta steineri]CAF3568544.1 unnamed protein product [Adineta steineri]